MGKAGKALKQIMETHHISQNRLADAMGIERSNISCWVNEVRDPGAETLLEIRRGLQKIDLAVAEEFIAIWLRSEGRGNTEDDSTIFITQN